MGEGVSERVVSVCFCMSVFEYGVIRRVLERRVEDEYGARSSFGV